jgi:hypothetical protein
MHHGKVIRCGMLTVARAMTRRSLPGQGWPQDLSKRENDDGPTPGVTASPDWTIK